MYNFNSEGEMVISTVTLYNNDNYPTILHNVMIRSEERKKKKNSSVYGMAFNEVKVGAREEK